MELGMRINVVWRGSAVLALSLALLASGGCACTGSDVDESADRASTPTTTPAQPSEPVDAASTTEPPPASIAEPAATSAPAPVTSLSTTAAESSDPPVASMAPAPPSSAAPPDAAAAADEVEQAIDGFIVAFRERRGDDGCAALTAEARAELVARAEAEGLRGATCADALVAAADSAGTGTRTALRFASIEDVTIDGDSGRARVDVFGESFPVELERREDTWLISRLPDV